MGNMVAQHGSEGQEAVPRWYHGGWEQRIKSIKRRLGIRVSVYFKSRSTIAKPFARLLRKDN